MRTAKPSLLMIIVFVIGSLFGSGILWQWKRVELEGQQQELESVVKITNLRQLELDQYSKLIELVNEYEAAWKEYNKTSNLELGIKANELKAQLDTAKDNFTALESKLAKLEGRPPRSLDLAFIPPVPPIGLKGVSQ